MERTSTEVGQQQRVGVDPQLAATLQRFNETFTRLDAKEFASFLAEDCTLVNPIGQLARGRDAAERMFEDVGRRMWEGATRTATIVSAREIADDCVLLDVDIDAQHFRRQDGTRGPMKLHATILARREGETWRWLDVRAYGFMPPPAQVH